MQAVDFLGKFFLSLKDLAAEEGVADFIHAQNLDKVEVPAAEFLEFREHINSVARAV